MEAFRTNEIVPDLVSTVPAKVMTVQFTKSGKTDVNLGKEIQPKHVTEAPDIQYEADPNSLYTLILTDPDAPNSKNPIQGERQQMLVVNIPSSNVSELSEGENLNEYIGSATPEGSELHQYTFLLYKQPKKLIIDEPSHSNTDPVHGNFSAENFAKKYNLGKPVEGNFYLAEYGESLPILRKKLGFN